MTKREYDSTRRYRTWIELGWCRALLALACIGILVSPPSWAQREAQPIASEPDATSRRASNAAAPRINERLTARELGLVINTNDPYSVAVGEFYRRARQLTDAQVLRVELPRRAELTLDEFEALQARIKAFFGPDIQALALAWVEPFAVSCNSITGALALGYDSDLCWKSCSPSRPSRYFNSASARPYTDLQLRPSMLLAAKDVAMAEAMIRRGVASDHTLGLRGAPDVNAHYLITADKARSARAPLFPAPGRVKGFGVDIHVEESEVLEGVQRLLLYETGKVKVDKLDTLQWVPGGLGDHLTSYGGRLDGKYGQMSALEWISSGATGSYGTVSEPCSHPQKFPHPQIVLLHYVQGATLIEAYWKSVAWPQQALFIGEPLAAP
ncbi:MAG: TIGR03790 family protein, partial [Burkholderiales bacterium]